MPSDLENASIEITKSFEYRRSQVKVTILAFRASILDDSINRLAVSINADLLEAPAALISQGTVLDFVL